MELSLEVHIFGSSHTPLGMCVFVLPVCCLGLMRVCQVTRSSLESLSNKLLISQYRTKAVTTESKWVNSKCECHRSSIGPQQVTQIIHAWQHTVND